jgi:hypothetical protein
MKNALICPNQPVETGYRVAEVADATFEVAPPLFWVECADDVVADQFWYDPSDDTIKLIPEPPEPEQPVTQGTQTL